MEKKGEKKDLHILRRHVMGFGEKQVAKYYIDITKDMYDGVVTTIRTTWRDVNSFSITIGLHQGSTLSPYLFVLAMDKLTRYIQNEMLLYMLVADDIVLIDESR